MRASADLDVQMRAAAFDHVRQLTETHDHLGASQLGQGFSFAGERIPLYNPQRGIFKPQKMRFLLSIRTVFPKKGNKVWYDDQRDVHRQIFESDETVDYAFKGNDPEDADNRWLHEAFENRVPIIYFLGIAPGRYQAMIPTFVAGWDAVTLKARIAFGVPEQDALRTTRSTPWSGATPCARSSSGFIRLHFVRQLSRRTTVAVRCQDCPSHCFWMQHTLFPTGTNDWANRSCERYPAIENPSRRFRCASDRHRSRLSIACLGAPVGPDRRPDA